jgi:MarR family transcriptional regulator, temperature-dependent positive regulator of motility
MSSLLTPQQEDAHFRVLQENPTIRQRELAEQLGVSLGLTNYVLKALAEKGAIKIQNFKRSDYKLA